MTIGSCVGYCQQNGYKYSGLQYGIACFCGSSYGYYGSASSDSQCNITCTGSNNTNSSKCGGYLRNSIYGTIYGKIY